jgi:hypothetical protein
MDALPLALTATVGDRLAGGQQVRWDGDRVVYDRLGPGFARREQVEVFPRDDDWARFWSDLDEAGVWGWRRSYGADPAEAPARDGVSWQLRVAVGGRIVDAAGEDAYPDGEEPGPSFRAVCEALSRLAGGRPFGA